MASNVGSDADLPRRHSVSMAIQSMRLTPLRQRSLSTRRRSSGYSLRGLTRSLSVGLGLQGKTSSATSSIDLNLYLDKEIVETALVRHWQDTNIKVPKSTSKRM